MFFIKGNRKARVKVYQHHTRQCDDCKDFDLTIGVYQDYFHVFFVPVIATGLKSSVIYWVRVAGIGSVQTHHPKNMKSKSRAPFYLYSGLLLVGLVVLSLLAAMGWGTYKRSRYISAPK